MTIGMPDTSTSLLEILQQQYAYTANLDLQIRTQNSSGTLLEIPPTGKIVSSAYEQLRNAAEYAEEHLLLQRAVKRFFNRNLFVTKRLQDDLGTELIVDLTQAGYLEGLTFSKATASAINKLTMQHMRMYGRLLKADISHDKAAGWVLALLSTETENLLHPHNIQQAPLLLAYQHFQRVIPKSQTSKLPDNEEYDMCLYIAIHQAILKSDIDIIRHGVHRLYEQRPDDSAKFITISKQVDRLFGSPLTQTLKRAVNRNGAPFRVLLDLIDGRDDTPSLLKDKARFLEAYDHQIDQEYPRLKKRLARGLTKSIIFIFITKVIIGIAIEVPYDFLLHGRIIKLPLFINLLFPPLYMASLTMSLKMPVATNKQLIHQYMANVLYGVDRMELQLPKRRPSTVRTKLIYTLAFCIPLIITTLILRAIGFNVVQMIIFFVFFSTASFLGFRLNMLIRELELQPRQSGLLASLQDFFYLPFVAVGQWLSRRYSQINVIALFLDVVIELPLKTILRLLRQWINYVREKHEELY